MKFCGVSRRVERLHVWSQCVVVVVLSGLSCLLHRLLHRQLPGARSVLILAPAVVLLWWGPVAQDPDFATFSQLIGLASLGASDEDIAKLATVRGCFVLVGRCCCVVQAAPTYARA